MSDLSQLPDDLKELADSLAKAGGMLGLYDVAEHLKPAMDELDLWDALQSLRENGYAVIPNVAPPEAMDDLREAIHRIAQETKGPAKGVVASMLLGRDPAVDRIATAPKILALAEVSVGAGMRASQFLGTILAKTGEFIVSGIHADQNWIPSPFPEHNCVITFCVPCEGMTADGGATRYHNHICIGAIQRRKSPKARPLPSK